MTTGVVTRNGASEKQRLVEGEAILRDWNNGAQVSSLTEKYGLSRATVYRRIDEAVKARVAPTVDAYREAQNALLDELMSKWKQQLDAADVMIDNAMTTENMKQLEIGFKMRGDSLAGMQKVAERRAKLMGLDAPVRADVSVTVTSATDAAIEALAAEVGAL